MEAMHLYTVCDEVSRVYVMWLFCKPVGDELPLVRFLRCPAKSLLWTILEDKPLELEQWLISMFMIVFQTPKYTEGLRMSCY